MTLYRRGRNYSIQLWVDGVRHLKSTGTNNRREAENIERQFREELNRRRHQIREASQDMTFAALVARFLADGSPCPYHLDRLKVLLPYFGESPIGRISKPIVREFRRDRHKEKPKLTETTLNRDVEVLRHLLYWAVDEGFLTANPLARIHLAKQRRKPRPIMSLAEEDKVLTAASPHLHKIIVAALDSGMRRGELLTQRWEHVDFNRRLLLVTHSKTPGGEAREIPLTVRLAELLSSLKKPEGLGFHLQRPSDPPDQDGLESNHPPRRHSLLPLSGPSPHIQHPAHGSGRDPGREEGPHGPLLGRGSQFTLHPRRVAGEA